MSTIKTTLVLCVCLLLLNACGVAVSLDQPSAAASSVAEASAAPSQAAAASAASSASASPEPSVAPSPSPSATASASPSAESSEAAASPSAGSSAPAEGEVVEGSAPAEGQVVEGEVAATACPSPEPIAAGEPQPVAQATAPPALLLILDSSGSMQEDDGTGRRKLDAAKDALNTLVDSLPDGAPVGLRVYGHRFPNTDKANSCTDTELIVPIGPLDKGVMKERIAGFSASGFTPIATSLQEAAKDLPAEGERTIVLVSDGEETCDRDPCQVAKDLMAAGIDVAVEAVGFQVDEATRTQLECIAEATGGAYHDAADAAQLASTLQQLSTRALRTYQTSGAAVQGGETYDRPTLLIPGQYTDAISTGRTLYYAVPLQAGQRLDFTATVIGQPDIGPSEGAGTGMDLALLAPNGDELESDFETFGNDTSSAVVRSEPVTQTGLYVVVFAADQVIDDLQARQFTTELLIRIDGESCVPVAAAVPPGPVQGSGDFNNAPPLTNGVYQDTIQTNETLYYAVYLEQGQGLRSRITLEGQPGISPTDAAGARLDVRYFTPVRESLEDESASGFGDKTVQVQIEFPSVSEEGLYYIGIDPDQYTNFMEGVSFNLTLAVEIIG